MAALAAYSDRNDFWVVAVVEGNNKDNNKSQLREDFVVLSCNSKSQLLRGQHHTVWKLKDLLIHSEQDGTIKATGLWWVHHADPAYTVVNAKPLESVTFETVFKDEPVGLCTYIAKMREIINEPIMQGWISVNGRLHLSKSGYDPNFEWTERAAVPVDICHFAISEEAKAENVCLLRGHRRDDDVRQCVDKCDDPSADDAPLPDGAGRAPALSRQFSHLHVDDEPDDSFLPPTAPVACATCNETQ